MEAAAGAEKRDQSEHLQRQRAQQVDEILPSALSQARRCPEPHWAEAAQEPSLISQALLLYLAEMGSTAEEVHAQLHSEARGDAKEQVLFLGFRCSATGQGRREKHGTE